MSNVNKEATYLLTYFFVPCTLLLLCHATTFRLRNDLYCVEWGVKLYSLTHVTPQPRCKKTTTTI